MAQNKSTRKKTTIKSTKKGKSKSEKTSRQTVIHWALDPLIENQKAIETTAKTLKVVSDVTGKKVEMVYVFSPSPLAWSSLTKPILGEIDAKVVEKMKGLAEKFGPSFSPQPKFLVSENGTLTKDVNRLMSYAKKSRTEFLALKTQARTGMERFFLGSFTETALLKAKVPILSINPETPPITKLKSVLVPVEDSKDSEKLVRKAVKLAKSWNVELVLFHKTPNMMDPALQSTMAVTGGGWMSLSHVFQENLERSEKFMARLMKKISDKGVKYRTVVDHESYSVTEGILKATEKENVDLIYMASYSGTISSAIFGSITRSVIRSSKVPVLAEHL